MNTTQNQSIDLTQPYSGSLLNNRRGPDFDIFILKRQITIGVHDGIKGIKGPVTNEQVIQMIQMVADYIDRQLTAIYITARHSDGSEPPTFRLSDSAGLSPLIGVQLRIDRAQQRRFVMLLISALKVAEAQNG